MLGSETMYPVFNKKFNNETLHHETICQQLASVNDLTILDEDSALKQTQVNTCRYFTADILIHAGMFNDGQKNNITYLAHKTSFGTQTVLE